MDGCLAVNAIGKSGGLVMMWKEGTNVEIKICSSNHIDSLSQEGRKRVGSSVKGKWIIGGDFNAILENSEKEGGRRKPQTLMDDFRAVVDELSLVDLKTDNGWFTWVNNREGTAMVKERLDHFLISANDVASFPFIETKAEAKNIIKNAWKMDTVDTMGKMDKVGHDLGVWQYNKYKKMSKQIDTIKSKINRLIDRPDRAYGGNKLKAMRRDE
ncbi:hypothetical protein GOBAR_AA11928 [Gossypium barbadense]|uniref:Endonuclease/exonuclease/phosphatase domain-containing protein n=1 Tax=Gossypium barbadense TaxID=3634 RepID=A0A2P5XZE1_GOSBA|nr:hypothetical protein GOBAR_AA11928 [Gossypium barbadense]